MGSDSLHIICGNCGSRDHLKYRIAIDVAFPPNNELYKHMVENNEVLFRCDNCGSICTLNEILEKY